MVEACLNLILVVEHEALLLVGPEAEADVEVVPEARDVGQSQIQEALTGEVSFTSHLREQSRSEKKLLPLSSESMTFSTNW